MAEETPEYYLRNAVGAFDKAKALASSTSDLRADWTEIFTLVKYAMEDIAKAKSIDPTATIDVGPVPTSPHSLAADMMLFEGTISTTEGLSEKTIRSGISALKNFLKYNEDAIGVLLSLTVAYIRVYERDQAIDTLNSLLRRDPANIEGRRLKDAFKNDPNLGLAPSTSEPFYSQSPRPNDVPDKPPPYKDHSQTLELNSAYLFGLTLFTVMEIAGIVPLKLSITAALLGIPLLLFNLLDLEIL